MACDGEANCHPVHQEELVCRSARVATGRCLIGSRASAVPSPRHSWVGHHAVQVAGFTEGAHRPPRLVISLDTNTSYPAAACSFDLCNTVILVCIADTGCLRTTMISSSSLFAKAKKLRDGMGACVVKGPCSGSSAMDAKELAHRGLENAQTRLPRRPRQHSSESGQITCQTEADNSLVNNRRSLPSLSSLQLPLDPTRAFFTNPRPHTCLVTIT